MNESFGHDDRVNLCGTGMWRDALVFLGAWAVFIGALFCLFRCKCKEKGPRPPTP